MPARRGINGEVLKYLRDHTNQEVAFMDIAEHLNLTTLQVSGAVSYLRKTCRINRPRNNWAIYRGSNSEGTAVSVKSKAEVVTILEDDKLLLNIEGKLYIAYELEVKG
jgi:hypothetical protein